MRWFIVLFLSVLVPSLAAAMDMAPPLPSHSGEWLDGKPLQWQDLKGKVVLLNVWTFACWNSYRSLPWVVSLQQKFPDLQIIGVHSPEFSYEKDRNRLRETMSGYKVRYPQILDDNHGYWEKLNNRYWPSFYVVDQNGTIRGRFAGETHSGDNQAKEMERLIETLLKERG